MLSSLYLGDNQLTALPAEIGNLTALKDLDLGDNQLTSLPLEIWNLTTLRSLDLSSNQLTSLPAEIGNLTALTDLNLHDNQLTALPTEIWNMSTLIYLGLSSNQLTTLPAEIGNLTALETLGIHRNQLMSLPAEIGNLTTLTGLMLGKNPLTSLPAEIGNLSALTFLSLENTPLTTLPVEIGNLTTLTALYLDNNQLTSLPAEIGNLTSLKDFYLDNNQLTSLPAEIGNLTALTTLYLDNNQLTSLPAEIGNLVALARLDLSGNALTSLPAEFRNLPALTTLYLDDNGLTSLPAEIWDLTTLTYLGLSGNHLTLLPAEIGNLTILRGLDLSNNQLTSLPAEIWDVTTLRSLGLNKNQLTSLPVEVGNLIALTDLWLGDNQLTSLPAEIGNLTALRELYIANNQLTSLPTEIGNLSALLWLYLWNNQLTSLPAEIGNLTTLSHLYLHDNLFNGELPASLTTLTSLNIFTFYRTGWCVPSTGAVPAWLDGISIIYGTGQVCGQAPGSISGVVTRPDTTPAARIQVNIYQDTDFYWDMEPIWVRWRYVTTTHTLSDGSYQVGGLGQGTDYRVQFVDPTHQYASEYYDDQPTLDLATPVTVTLGMTRTAVNAVLDSPQSPLASVETDGGSVTPHLQDGTVTINVMRGHTDDVTVTQVVTCAIGSPSGVTLTLTPPDQTYPMTMVGTDQYQATVPGTYITEDADLVVVAICGGTTTETVVAHINLYDPSGTVSNAVTGQPIEDATVTLYQVPGWQPKNGPDDDRPNTCESNASKAPSVPWSQPAPTNLGIVVNPEVTAIEPSLSYQLTGEMGDYGWDVEEGCWYVQVTAEGYQSLVSPVVGVPPVVTDLDLALDYTPGVALAPDWAGHADPGYIITYTHVLTNTSDGSDTFDLNVSSSQGWPVALGGLRPSGTAHLPWQMGPGMTATILVSVTVPTDAISDTVDSTVVTATSQTDINTYATVTDRTTVNHVPGVTLTPDHAGYAGPGRIVTYTHVLTNTGNGSDAFDLDVSSSQGWPVALGGLYPSRIPHLPWRMGPGMTATILVSISVPTDVVSDTMDSTVITATSQSANDIYATVIDHTTVNSAPSVALAPDRARNADPGHIITYTHVLTNTSNGSDTFDLDVSSSQGWPVTLEGLYPSGTAHLPWRMGPGMTSTFLVTVTVPTDAISDTMDVTIVTATSQAEPSVYAAVTTVNQVPGVALAPDRASRANPGHVVTYTHVLTNSGNGPDAFDLDASSSQGWPVTLGGLSPSFTAHLPWRMGPGMTATLVVSLTVPDEAACGVTNIITLTATSQRDPNVFGTVFDTTTLITYEVFLPLVLRQ